MIDKKKIKEAAKAYEKKCDEAINDMLNGKPYDGDPYDFCGFEAGANWALQEFKKSLWHDVSEEPETSLFVPCVIQLESDLEGSRFGVSDYHKNCGFSSPKGWIDKREIIRWCYLSDILPRKGGEQC